MEATFSFKGYDLPVNLVNLTGGGPETFAVISDWHQALLKQWIDLKPTDFILEIGCGIGRDAIPLTEYLTTGRYIGVDIIKPSIDWCASQIGAKFPHFKFIHFDVLDELHNSAGTIANKDVRFPIDSGSVDKIFLFSVFTHMLRSDIEHYLREFRRIIKSDGLIYATTFLYNEDILSSARRTNLTPYDLRFEHEAEPGCRINDLKAPLGAVAYTREVWNGMVADAGLAYAKPFLRGGWSGFYSDAQEGQDVAILSLSGPAR